MSSTIEFELSDIERRYQSSRMAAHSQPEPLEARFQVMYLVSDKRHHRLCIETFQIAVPLIQNTQFIIENVNYIVK